MANQLSPETLKQLRQQFDAALAMPLPEAAPRAAALGSVDICKVWPEIKPILQAAVAILSIAYPPAAKALTVLLGIGDQVYGATCK